VTSLGGSENATKHRSLFRSKSAALARFVNAFLTAGFGVASMRHVTASLRPSRASELSIMPQPLSRVMPSAIVIMCNAGDRPLNHNPELGLLAMEAIISWSNVERFMLNMYLKLMGGSQDLAAVSFLAQTTQNAKEASINAVAKHVLDEKYFELLRAILTASKPGQLGRDKLAHWTWGYSPNIPDGFLLADPRNTHTDFDRNLIFVYKKQDFIDIIKLNDELCGFGLRF
jgi:hypothetical protein